MTTPMKELSQYKTWAVPVAEIWVDPKFNCRDTFLPDTVRKLADSIATEGLQYPVIVRPREVANNPPYRYELVAGFRRFAAFKLLKRVEIPAMVTETLTDYEAHKLNLLENLERKDLNILEEARGIRHIFPNGESDGVIAKELGRTPPWVHRRTALLELPVEVQYMIASERLVQVETDWLISLLNRHDDEVILKKAYELLDAKRTGKIRKFIRENRVGRTVSDTRRTKGQIADMIAFMFSLNINGLPPRVAAWCAGTISDEDLKSDLIVWRDSIRCDD